MMTTVEKILTIATLTAGTALTRFLPFIVFRGKQTPCCILYLSTVLPPAVFGMLVVYCLKDVNFTSEHYGVSEMLCIAITVVFHAWRRQMMLSIFGGTAAYMLLVGYLC
ncbi:MAG: AzlD domain-containing protein [Prevotella sp.]|nr:AzlD domain-containing protein [Prevotella sp.]MDD7046430.1 AzlD domain-containing protein [Prevotella sp.]MDY5547287.1 AzlD domain-containing protein [Prevotella sp.]